jgi:beta-lactamase regulating signal transducer with metallopeptidase domain
MAEISYSFCMAMLHSLWQGALLLGIYWVADKVLQHRFTPQLRKNLLFVSLSLQTILFIISFLIYYSFNEFNIGNTSSSNFANTWLNYDFVHTSTPWIFMVYACIVVFKLIQTIYNWYAFKQQFNASISKPSIELKLFTTNKAHHVGIKRKVTLWLSNNITTPFTFGFLKPVIVLPVALINQLSTQQAEALILHELTHIKANDYLFNWLVTGAESIFFFNPFILRICKNIKLEREKLCDITVTAFNYSPLLYAEALLQAQKFKQQVLMPMPVASINAIGKTKQLLQRIQFFTQTKNQLQQTRKALPVLTTILLLAIVTIASLIQFKFSAGKKAAATVVLTPVANNNNFVENVMPKIVNTVLEHVDKKAIEKIVKTVQQQQPLIEKELKKLAPVIKNIEAEAAAIAEQMKNINLTEPTVDEEALISEISLEEKPVTKQIIVQEEQSGTTKTTFKVYTLTYVKGRWILQPQWKATKAEYMIFEDSSIIKDASQAHKE